LPSVFIISTQWRALFIAVAYEELKYREVDHRSMKTDFAIKGDQSWRVSAHKLT